MEETLVSPPQIEVTTQNQALTILVNAARVAQSKGIFSLEEAELISKSIKMFMPTTVDGPTTM